MDCDFGDALWHDLVHDVGELLGDGGDGEAAHVGACVGGDALCEGGVVEQLLDACHHGGGIAHGQEEAVVIVWHYSAHGACAC